MFGHLYAGGPAPLCGNLQRLRAQQLPRPHGQARRGTRWRRASGHRHRSDQPGAQFALDRHHDGLNDHLKLLFARAAQLFDRQTAQPVRHDSPRAFTLKSSSVPGDDPRLVVTFPVELPGGTSAEQVEQWLSASGFTKVQAEREVATPTGPRKVLDVVADRFRLGNAERRG